MIIIKKADTFSIPVIQQLAHRIWNTAYKNILSAEQIQYMLQYFYSDEALRLQMQQGQCFLLAVENNNAVGYASYSINNSIVPCMCKLHKLYVDNNQQGKGIGKLLLNFVQNIALSNYAAHIELNVHRQNKASHFYRKNGFEILKEEDLAFGGGYFMNDYRMLKKL